MKQPPSGLPDDFKTLPQKKQVIAIICEQFCLDFEEAIKDPKFQEKSFNDDFGADSLDTIEMIMAFEENLEINIPEKGEDGAENVQTVGQAIALVEKIAEQKKKQ